MLELQIFFQRRRKVLMRVAALLAVGLGGLLAVLPRADAHDARTLVADVNRSFLLSPEPMSGEGFATFYAPAHR